MCFHNVIQLRDIASVDSAFPFQVKNKCVCLLNIFHQHGMELRLVPIPPAQYVGK
jgi:hypothetical protein